MEPMETTGYEMFITQFGAGGVTALPQQALHLLLSFLGRSRQLEPDLRAELERLGIQIPEGSYCIAVFEVDELQFDAQQPLPRHWQRIAAYERLSRDLVKVFCGSIEGFLFLALGYLVGILFSVETDAPQQLCSLVLEEWNARDGGRFSATFSRRCEQMSQAAMAYEEVSNRQRGRLFFGGLPKLLDGEALAESREYLWSSRFAEVDTQLQQFAQRICGAILTEQPEQAHVWMDKALDLLLDEGVHSTYYVEVQMIGALFSARLAGALKEAGILQPEYEARHSMAAALLECHKDREFRQKAHACLDGYVQHYRAMQTDRSAKLMAALREFLVENAFDPQVGLGMAAKQFGSHPATLATGFRKAYGESVGDFINRTRVQRAKELLEEGGVSVQSVSEQVGFCSGTTMYRAFLRYEGRPPKSFKGTGKPKTDDHSQ